MSTSPPVEDVACDCKGSTDLAEHQPWCATRAPQNRGSNLNKGTFALARCDRCSEPLFETGALVFGPPMVSSGRCITTMKLHICEPCWQRLFEWVCEVAEAGS